MKRSWAVALLGAVLLLGACASHTGSAAAPRVSDAVVEAAAAGESVVIRVALYSDDGDSLVSASVAPEIAARVDVIADEHSHRGDGQHGHLGHLDPGGSLGPERETDPIEIPASNTISLGPGREHLLLVGLKRALAPADEFTITMVFERGGEVQAVVAVADVPQ